MNTIKQTTTNEPGREIVPVKNWVEQKYGCTILLNPWTQDHSSCASFELPFFIISYTNTISALHELGHVVVICELGLIKTNSRHEFVNELEAWRIAEELAELFGITFDDFWQEALGSYCIKGMMEKTITEEEIINLLWG